MTISPPLRLALLLPLALLMLTLAGCGGQAAIIAPPSPDEQALAFVAALAAEDELALRNMALPGSETDILLTSSLGQWNRWNTSTLGPPSAMQVIESQVQGERALVTVASTHPRGTSHVAITFVWRVEAWLAETWHGSIPLDQGGAP